jgi:hypothetical protein
MKAGTFSAPAASWSVCPVEVATWPPAGSATGLVTSGASLPRIENVNWLRALSMQYAGAWVSG